VSETNGLSCRFDLERLDGWVTDGLGDAVRESLVDGSIDRDCGEDVNKVKSRYEHRRHTLPCFDFGRFDTSKVTCDIADVVILGGIIKDLGPESARLLKVDCTVVCQF
jgi:hypothetical protein